MNKIFRSAVGLLLAVLLLMLSSCGGTAANNAEATPSPTPEPVERTETVNIPESVLHRLDLDIAALSRRLELYNVTENIDGSCTVYMTAEEKESILSALKNALDAEMDALPESGTWPFLLKAELNADCTAVTLHSSAALYDPLRDRTAAEAIYLPVLLYTAFTAEDAEHFSLRFTVVDENGKTLDEYVHPQKDSEPASDEN